MMLVQWLKHANEDSIMIVKFDLIFNYNNFVRLVVFIIFLIILNLMNFKFIDSNVIVLIDSIQIQVNLID